MRKLASIQLIDEIIPIKGADSVELAKVLGWYTIVKIGQFKKGDLCCFFEIDSIVPERPEFEFMRPKKFRVKTMKSSRLGVVSQGLAMNLDILGDEYLYECFGGMQTFKSPEETRASLVGADVTGLLNVQKYEIPIEGGKNTKAKGMFPTYIVPETDELRIQAFPNLLQEIWGLPYVARIKYDGTSFTCYSFNEESGVCSRHQELYETDGDVYWRIAHIYDLPKRLVEYCKLIGKNYAIQGEICGPIVIHGGRNPLNAKIDDLHLFSVYDIDAHAYLSDAAAESVAKDLGIKFVTFFEKGDFFNYTIAELEEKTRGVFYPGTKNQVEGLVFRPKEYTYSPSIGGMLSFKVINKDYLLEEK